MTGKTEQWSGLTDLATFLSERDLTDTAPDWMMLLAKRLAGLPVEALEREAVDPASRELVGLFWELESERDRHFMKAAEATQKYGLCKGQIKQDVCRRRIRPREVISLGRENIIAVAALERLYGRKEEYYG